MELVDKIKSGKYYKVLDKNHPFFGYACKVEGGKWHQGNLIGALLKNPLDTGSESFLFNEIEECKKTIIMITPINIFEAWLGESLASYFTNEFKDQKNDISRKFDWLTVFIEECGEDGSPIGDIGVSDDKEVKELNDYVESLVSDMEDLIESQKQELLDLEETYEDLFNNHFGYEAKKQELGLAICKYHDHHGFNENHLLMAKNDKETFEALILSQV